MKEIDYKDYYWQNKLVRLRPLRVEDWEAHYYGKFDSSARKLLKGEIELPPSIDLEKKFTELFANFNRYEGRLMFAVENLEAVFIGTINLYSVDEKNGTFSIGVVITTEHRGKGFGTAAMEMLLRYAFFERRLNKFHNQVIEENAASAAMLKKLGCAQEGRITGMIYTNGAYRDILVFGLTKDEFVAHREGLS
jgi:RimJ/RimL family protein N-acetyltransferase